MLLCMESVESRASVFVLLTTSLWNTEITAGSELEGLAAWLATNTAIQDLK